MERKSFAGMDCSVAQCLEVVGEWWSLLIVRDTFLGVTRFDDFQTRLGISRNILTNRLNHLVEAGVLQRVSYQDNPPRSDYRLTDKGRDLWHVITAMRQWGDRWAAPGGEPLVLQHKACGLVLRRSARREIRHRLAWAGSERSRLRPDTTVRRVAPVLMGPNPRESSCAC